jgi:hypothetical protein
MDSVRLRRPSRHSLTRARATPAHGAEIEPKQTSEHGRRDTPETEHHPQRTTHRTLETRRVGRSHAAEYADNANAVRD